MSCRSTETFIFAYCKQPVLLYANVCLLLLSTIGNKYDRILGSVYFEKGKNFLLMLRGLLSGLPLCIYLAHRGPLLGQRRPKETAAVKETNTSPEGFVFESSAWHRLRALELPVDSTAHNVALRYLRNSRSSQPLCRSPCS